MESEKVTLCAYEMEIFIFALKALIPLTFHFYVECKSQKLCSSGNMNIIDNGWIICQISQPWCG